MWGVEKGRIRMTIGFTYLQNQSLRGVRIFFGYGSDTLTDYRAAYACPAPPQITLNKKMVVVSKASWSVG